MSPGYQEAEAKSLLKWPAVPPKHTVNVTDIAKKKQIMQLSSSLSRCSINSTEECVALVDQ